MQRAGGLFIVWQSAWSLAMWHHDINAILILCVAAFVAPIIAMRILED